jgi:AcrR family transcriptional regulator
MTAEPRTRADRRRATEERILWCARALFAEQGFERTTIRAVAAAATVDPSLVMQYFGSKKELFERAAQVAVAGLTADDPDDVVEQLLATLGVKLGSRSDGTLAMLRSMLTSPAAAEHARRALGRQIAGVAGVLPGADEADLRAALAISVMIGVTIGHQLLGLDGLRDVPPDRVAPLLRPALAALLTAESGGRHSPRAR